jgi:hypothetical protein
MSVQGQNWYEGLFGTANKTLQTATQLYGLKWLMDINDGEFGLTVDPNNGVGISPTRTVGSAAPKSIWQSYDMLFLGAGAVIIIGALALRK